MIMGNVEIPDLNSEDEMNFDDIFKVNETELMKLLDADTAAKIAEKH